MRVLKGLGFSDSEWSAAPLRSSCPQFGRGSWQQRNWVAREEGPEGHPLLLNAGGVSEGQLLVTRFGFGSLPKRLRHVCHSGLDLGVVDDNESDLDVIDRRARDIDYNWGTIY